MKYTPNPIIFSLGEDFYDKVTAAHFLKDLPRYLNKAEMQNLGLDLILNDEQAWSRHFVKFQALPQNIDSPLALRYHGHQFRTYNPDLGDGRGFLFAQLQDTTGRTLDLGTKGSGKTPYSRSGDGCLTLKGAFREALATELLESLGVNTSKTFCFFETGAQLIRHDEPSPTRSAVLTRLSHSHIRFGTFQRLAFLGQSKNIEKLVGYSVENYFPQLKDLAAAGSADQAILFLQEVTQRSAKLCAQWMISGFVHGVLNTDNMNITGESFDYGPFRFLASYDPAFTAAYFDHRGLYCYGRQPTAVHWNLFQLAESLRAAYPDLDPSPILAKFSIAFTENFEKFFFRRLNLKPKENATENQNLIAAFFNFLERPDVQFEQSFFDCWSLAPETRRKASPQGEAYLSSEFLEFQKHLEQYTLDAPEKAEHAYFAAGQACTLLIEEVESLWLSISENDDWKPFYNKIDQIRSFRGLYQL